VVIHLISGVSDSFGTNQDLKQGSMAPPAAVCILAIVSTVGAAVAFKHVSCTFSTGGYLGESGG